MKIVKVLLSALFVVAIAAGCPAKPKDKPADKPKAGEEVKKAGEEVKKDEGSKPAPAPEK